MSDSKFIFGASPSSPFLAECGSLISMDVSVTVDGVSMHFSCHKFEVTSIKEVNFMDARRADIAAQDAMKSE